MNESTHNLAVFQMESDTFCDSEKGGCFKIFNFIQLPLAFHRRNASRVGGGISIGDKNR